MPNTGKKIILTLKEVYVSDQTPTGDVKNNVVGDPDYIAPYNDFTDCAVTYALSCPTVLATGLNDQLTYEFAVSSSVINNPAVNKVNVRVMQGVVVVDQTLFTLPHSAYFSGTYNLPAGSYTINVVYLDASNNVLATCTGVTTYTVT